MSDALLSTAMYVLWNNEKLVGKLIRGVVIIILIFSLFQLLISIAFNQGVKIHSLKIQGPDDGEFMIFLGSNPHYINFGNLSRDNIAKVNVGSVYLENK